MPSIAVLIADGFETVEALMVMDACRRAGLRTRLVSTTGTYQVISAQQVQVSADERLDAVDVSSFDCVVIPGGLPSVRRLHANEAVRVLLRDFMGSKTVAASGVAPIALGELGLLAGRLATGCPGYESVLPPGAYVDGAVVASDGLITARTVGDLVPYALAIIERLAGPSAAEKAAEGMGAEPTWRDAVLQPTARTPR